MIKIEEIKFLIIQVSLLLFFLNESIFSQCYICAIGGGRENYNDWSDEPYKWIVEKSEKEKIIILSVNNATERNKNIKDEFKSAGKYSSEFNAEGLPGGVYLLYLKIR